MLVAEFNYYRNTDSTSVSGLFQWDYGQQLAIHGIDMPDDLQVHFALKGNDKAISCLCRKQNNDIVVDVPDELLTYGSDLKAWVYVLDKQSGKTIKTINMPVIRRAKPEIYEGDPEAKNILKTILDEVNKKSDGISFVNGDIQLLCRGRPLGTPITIPNWENDLSAVTEEEINGLF